MSKKHSKELMKLDFYEILQLPFDSGEQEIRKSYRKKALKCHPDKNPDNPDAAAEFDRLKKILEVLLDAGARRAYDKVLKSRKAAALRARQADAKTQKLRTQLEDRERLAREQPQISEEEKLRRELKRLEDEGARIIEEELARVNQQTAEELSKRFSKDSPSNKPSAPDPGTHKVKVKWVSTEYWSGYTEEEIHRLFYKWGEINAVVMKQKKTRGTALIDYKTKQGADMAVQFEKGQIGKPVEVSHILNEPPKKPEPDKNLGEPKGNSKLNYDFESVAAMNQRRQEERRKLIEEIMQEEAKKK